MKGITRHLASNGEYTRLVYAPDQFPIPHLQPERPVPIHIRVTRKASKRSPQDEFKQSCRLSLSNRAGPNATGDRKPRHKATGKGKFAKPSGKKKTAKPMAKSAHSVFFLS